MANSLVTRSRKGFTLVEMVVAIAMLSVVSSAMIGAVLLMQENSVEIEARANSIAEASVANSLLSNILKNSYGIDYAGTTVSEDE